MFIAQLKKIYHLLQWEFGAYKLQIAVLVVLSFVSSILESVGINAVIPLFAFVNKTPVAGDDAVSRAIRKFFDVFGIAFSLRYILIFIVALFVLKAAVLFVANLLAVAITTRYERKTRAELFQRTLEAHWPYLSKQKLGYLDQMLTTDVTQSSALLSYISMTIIIVANLVTYTFLVVNIAPWVAIAVFVFGILAALAFRPLFDRNRIASSRVADIFKLLAHHVNESILGIKTIKTMRVEESAFRKGREYFDEVKNLNVQITLWRNLTIALIQPVGLVLIVGLFAFFYKTNTLNFASFAVMVYAINKIFGNIQLAQAQLHTLSYLSPYAMSVLRYRNEVLGQKEVDTGTAGFQFFKQLAFDHVGFSYGENREVLHDASFVVYRGEMLGIIGPSGAGKTTIVDIVLRLYSPASGRVLVDGISADAIRLSDWRHAIGYVSQDAFLLNDTIERNIKFYDDTVTNEEMGRAAKMANIDEFICGLPKGYQSVVGERGVALSGGQRQRIVLARVLARNPELLVLDEATSALDSESEALIQRAIESLKGRITVIVIAHRLSTVMNCDRLLVVQEGRITEDGRPDVLLADPNSYFHKVHNLRDEDRLN